MKTLSQDSLNEVTRRLAAEFQPEQVWLFGSHAWGEPDEGSDLDLLVVVRHSDDLPVRRAQRAHRCLQGLGVAKDVLVKTHAELVRFCHVRSSLEAEILEHGCLITFVDAFMETSIRELKAHLSEYVRRASQGEIIKVTVHGREVANLVPQGRGEGAGRLAGIPGILWRGGKPEGLAGAEVMPKGIRLSDYVAEDRR